MFGRYRLLALVVLSLDLFGSLAAHAGDALHYAIAMHGTPKYAPTFNHFDYVNPDAPKGGSLRLGASGTFDSTNPFIVRGIVAQGLNTGYMSLVYESLMARSWDEPFTLYGLIAETVDVADDRSSITFHVNPKAHWSDGQTVTADDVLFSFITLRDKGRPNHRSYYRKVARADKVDTLSVTFTFTRNPDGNVDREMPLIMGLMPVLPEHIWKDRDFNKTSLAVPVGSGPYKVVDIDPGRSISYVRDENYWGRDLAVERGMSNFDKVRFDYYRDDGIALEAFKAGQIDLRREYDINKWSTSYESPAVNDGRVKLETLPHQRTEPISGFVFNTRNVLLKNDALRAAMSDVFDSGWINRNIFHGQYKRAESFFPNSELAAPALPDEAETQLLSKYRSELPFDIFTKPITPPSTDGSDTSLRDHLLSATALLHDAGYVLRQNQLYSPDNQAVNFEILLNDPAEEKIAMTWARALQRLGISAHIHTVDSSQYQRRLAAFDYDITSAKWFNSLSPGNEQIAYWGPQSADQPGSRNYPGVKDRVIDELCHLLPAAVTRQELVTATHALDRVLTAGHYVVPFYYTGIDHIAWWTEHLHHPSTIPTYGTVLESWWSE